MASQPEGEFQLCFATGTDVNSILAWTQPPVLHVLLSLCCSFLAELRWSALMEWRFWRKRLRVYRSALTIHILFELPPPTVNRSLPLLCYFYADVGAAEAIVCKHTSTVKWFNPSDYHDCQTGSCWSPVFSRLSLTNPHLLFHAPHCGSWWIFWSLLAKTFFTLAWHCVHAVLRENQL